MDLVVDANILFAALIKKGITSELFFEDELYLITPEFILELLASGMSIEELLQEYPHLSREDVLASLKYATGALQHEEVYPTAKIA